MIEKVEINEPITIEDYASIASLITAVQDLRREAGTLVPKLKGRRVWMVNSTAQGGGVAEMLPKLVSMMNEIGIETHWLVLKTANEDFFRITKHLHNLIHGSGDPHLSDDDRRVFEEVAKENVDELTALLRPGDILAIHDPQPLALGAMVAEKMDVTFIWRCHIGVDRISPQTTAAWQFLEPYAKKAHHSIFTAPEYIPPFLAGNASVLHPAIDPLSHKNRYLSPIKTMGVLCNARLASAHSPTLMPDFEHTAERLQPDGTFAPANLNEDIGINYRPLITQVSRWDKLKGWQPLLEAFIKLKERVNDPSLDERQRHRIQLVRLVMAGPDPASVSDDPEGKEVLDRLCARYTDLPAEVQPDIALVVLPMASRKENALMVNTLQRCSSIVVQNSVEEGFGLTATEALYKRVPFLGTHACGLRQQVRDQMDGRLISDAENVEELCDTMIEMMNNPRDRDTYARNAQRRVHHEFLVFKQVERWLETLVTTLESRQTRA